MKYLKVFTDFADALEPLSDAERGRLFWAMLKYAETGAAPDLKGNERFVWGTAKNNIDAQRTSYDNRVAGIAKARESNPNNNQTEISSNQYCSELKTVQDQEKIRPREDQEKTRDTPLNPPRGTEYTQSFESFWSVYPRKTGKGAAFKSFQHAMKLTDLQTILSAVERCKASAQWKKDGGQYIPMPATWLNQRRWDDEVGGESSGRDADENPWYDRIKADVQG